MLEEVELVVQVVLAVFAVHVEHFARAALLVHESIGWKVLAAPKCASFFQIVHAPVEFLP